MIQDMIRGKWSLLSSRLKSKWSKLTDEDINRREGHRDYLINKLQERYGIAKEEAQREVDSWSVPPSSETNEDRQRRIA